MRILTTIEQLHALYGPPGEPARIKVTPRLTAEYRRMIEAAPFVALATAGPDGLDCSPRGDAGQVVFVEDDGTLLLPDWRGNNRVDSLANILRDPRVALLFLVPGINTAMRVNGRAVIAVDEAITTRFEVDGRHPRSVIVITIEQVYSQCARALLRAGLWSPATFRDPATLPTVGDMLAGIKRDFDGAAYDRDWPARAAGSMW